MERRLLLVFALTFLVIVLFQPLLKKYLPQSAAPAPEPPVAAQPSAQAAAATTTPPSALASVSGASRQALAEAETVVENDLYRVTFTNRGGLVKSWVLKTYFDEHGKPLELVSNAAPTYGYPMSLWTYDEAQRNKINSALYVASDSGSLKAPAKLTFEYSDADVSVRKAFSFDHTYVVHLETSVVSKGSQVSALPMWPAGFGDQSSPSSYAASRIEHQYNDKIERLDIKKISGGATLPGPFNWAGGLTNISPRSFFLTISRTQPWLPCGTRSICPKTRAIPSRERRSKRMFSESGSATFMDRASSGFTWGPSRSAFSNPYRCRL